LPDSLFIRKEGILKFSARLALKPLARNLKTSVGLTLLFLLALSSPLIAADFSVSGESKTIVRMQNTTDDRNLYPLYEYLRMGMSGKLSDGSTLGLYMGGWGRVDLADKTTNNYSDTDLQYFYLSYGAAKNNSVMNLGRQFVTEGIASEKIDGLYARSDFASGIGASVFIGRPVMTDPTYKEPNLVYGGRVSHSMPNLYILGISALKSEADHNSQYREEEGIDLWFHPLKMVDLTGRSSYNSITNGWMEHAYTLTLSPLPNLKVTFNITDINYTDYYYNMTTSALSLNNGFIVPGESLLTLGSGVSYNFLKNFTVSADYKNYNYDIAGSADYFGGKLSYAAPEIITAGLGWHRMSGDNDNLRYNEYRLYALKKLGHIEISADLFNTNYDNRMNGVKNSYALTGAVGYEINHKLKIGGDVTYSRNPDFDDEVSALVKLTYLFDTKFSDGRGKSEK
jgi:hypothetical protein